MTTPKSVKIASIVSLAAIGVWLLAIALIDIFQDAIASSYMGTSYVGENEHLFLASTMVYIISAAVVAACNILIINGKTTLVPLILSGTAALVSPIIATVAHSLQTILAAKLQGEYALARIAALANCSGFASHILNAAFFCTVAASAVYAYARKKS